MRSDCTSRPPGSLLRGRTLAVWVLALAVFATGQHTAQADTELFHSGETGRHRLADIYDSPGAVCDIVLPGKDSLGETWIRVNPPIMFARDRTEDVDSQDIGWRAIVYAVDPDTEERRMVRQSAINRDSASDNLASYFSGQGWLAEFPMSVSRATYEVEVEMIWYAPDDPQRIEGRAVHGVEYFMMVLRHHGEARSGRTAQAECHAPRGSR